MTTNPVRLMTPMLTGVRDDARRLIDHAGLPGDLSDIDVLLDGHETLAATPAYADELIRVLLVERQARSLRIRLAGKQFTAWLLESARRHGVTGRVVA